MRSLFGLLAAALTLAPLPLHAQRLSTSVMPDHYDLAFAVDLAHNRFDGSETIKVRTTEPTTRVVLHALEITFHEVTVGTGAAAQRATVVLDESAQTATLTVPKPIAPGSTEIHIRYTGVLNDKLRGFYTSEGPKRSYAVTQFESTDARRAFPCFDEPGFKATFAVKLTIDRGDTAISNGKLVSDTPGPSPARHTMTFAPTPKMSTYLVAMAVGDFQCLDGAAENVPIRICATPDKKQLGKIALDAAQDILRFYNRYFGIKYPFGKLDVLAVPDFAAGAMENTAAIFYREADLLADAKTASVETRKNIASVLAHEMAHQWFGDLVTMQWWDDIWLNEGFATWMANKPLDASHADWNVAVDEAAETQRALSLDSLKATRPIHSDVATPAEIDEAFDAIAYEKGAAVLRMIEHYVGADTFKKGINAYLAAHAYQNATSEDFSKAISATSGKPVERILPTFVNQPGVPLIDVSDLSCDAATSETRATLAQSRFLVGDTTAAAGRWQVPVCVAGQKDAADSCHLLTELRQTVPVAKGCASWVFANAGARGYYRTAYSPAMLRAMAPHIEGELTPAERLSLIDDEWALVRAGRHSAAEYLTLVTAFGRERTSVILSEIIGHVNFIHDYLAMPEQAPKLGALVRSLLRPALDELSFSPAPSDADDRRALRAAVVSALGTTGNDPDVIAKSRAALDRSLQGGAPLEASLAAAVTSVAAGHGDRKLFDALVAASERASDPEERYRTLSALAAFRDPALTDRGLQMVLTPQVRSQDASLQLARFLGNPAARAKTWTFIKANWTALQPKVAISGGDTKLVAALGTFCDAPARDDIKGFFSAHPLPGAARTLDQTLERIDNCLAIRTAQAANVASWLNSR
jgi:aminopeptidase N